MHCDGSPEDEKKFTHMYSCNMVHCIVCKSSINPCWVSNYKILPKTTKSSKTISGLGTKQFKSTQGSMKNPTGKRKNGPKSNASFGVFLLTDGHFGQTRLGLGFSVEWSALQDNPGGSSAAKCHLRKKRLPREASWCLW